MRIPAPDKQREPCHPSPHRNLRFSGTFLCAQAPADIILHQDKAVCQRVCALMVQTGNRPTGTFSAVQHATERPPKA